MTHQYTSLCYFMDAVLKSDTQSEKAYRVRRIVVADVVDITHIANSRVSNQYNIFLP